MRERALQDRVLRFRYRRIGGRGRIFRHRRRLVWRANENNISSTGFRVSLGVRFSFRARRTNSRYSVSRIATCRDRFATVFVPAFFFFFVWPRRKRKIKEKEMERRGGEFMVARGCGRKCQARNNTLRTVAARRNRVEKRYFFVNL